MKRSPMKRRNNNPTTPEQDAYHDMVRELGCIVHICGGPASIHHAETGGGGRKDHWKVLPLCHYHHQGDQGLHTLSRRVWEPKYGTEQELLQRVADELGMP